jgi:hypothetical protein
MGNVVGEIEVGKQMLAYERAMYKQCLRGSLPCDTLTVEARRQVREDAKVEANKAWEAIFEVITLGRLLSIQQVTEEMATGSNADGWLSKGSIASHMRTMVTRKFIALIPQEMDATLYVRLAKEFNPDTLSLEEDA